MTAQTQENTNTPASPKWFTLVAILALIWNLMGVMAFISQMMMTPDRIAQLPSAEQTLYNSIPFWAICAFACAVFGGVLGSLALLIRKTFAQPLLILSLTGVTIQMFHAFVVSISFEVLGPQGSIMPMMVVLVAIALVRLSIKAKNQGWLT